MTTSTTTTNTNRINFSWSEFFNRFNWTNLVPRHGNYCGPGWPPANLPPPELLDNIDPLCSDHDTVYGHAAGTFDENERILTGDLDLLRSARRLDQSRLSAEEANYAERLVSLFNLKIRIVDLNRIFLRESPATMTAAENEVLDHALAANNLSRNSAPSELLSAANRTSSRIERNALRRHSSFNMNVQADVQYAINSTRTTNGEFSSRGLGVSPQVSRTDVLRADRIVRELYRSAEIGTGLWGVYTDWSTEQLILQTPVFQRPNFTTPDTSPIGAYYESQSAGYDAATSIAANTFRIVDQDGNGVTASQLLALDANGDGALAGTELADLFVWRDLNEDGSLNVADVGADDASASTEKISLIDALAQANQNALRESDFAHYTQGNAHYRTAAETQELDRLANAANLTMERQLLELLAPPSAYDQLRAIDNRFILNGSQWIDWAPTQIKISSNQNNLVGTAADDRFDVNYYAAYNGRYFDLSRIHNFYGGGGNDTMGGSEGNDTLWGGTGNDALLGYGGDDTMYGESGNDEIQGGSGNDRLDGGEGDDSLFGQAGNDTLIGGNGNDTLKGFTANNQAQQTLAAGETDNDLLSGGNGDDQLWGGWGDDTLRGDAGNDQVLGESGDDLLYGGAGNDTLLGGDGNDILYGHNATNHGSQTLAIDETDNDTLSGAAGDDLLVGSFGRDLLLGGDGSDELQGGEGDDRIYGDAGNDRLFGGADNDTLYGGVGDDLLVGGMASNEVALAEGASDSNMLYGGAGNDTLLGGVGNDYLDGGAGADHMEGGYGDDTYIVNTVNDVILEQQNEGYDTVIAGTSYVLNTGIEALRLIEGGHFNGTGNQLNNTIIGNSQNNILDGVTGADLHIGGLGNDAYYVEDVGDQVIELAEEGIDTVYARIDYSLGSNIENLGLLDFTMGEKGTADGVAILVYGYPKAFELDYMQGNGVVGYRGTCALTAVANLTTQAQQGTTESHAVQSAIDNGWCVTDAALPEHVRGGSNFIGQQALLSSYGIRNGLLSGYNEYSIANLIRGGRGVILGLNAGVLWDESAMRDHGGVNHAVTVTGVAIDAETGDLNGFYIADSGRGKVSDMTRYIALADFRAAADVANAYAIYTIEPIKLWEEDLRATGNDLNNQISGNRGDNVLTGGRGNDVLIGGAGDDTYIFNAGDGQDTIIDTDPTLGNIDTLQLNQIDQSHLWIRQIGMDLQITVIGTTDQITLKNWVLDDSPNCAHAIERIQTGEQTLHYGEVNALVQAMASFAPPASGELPGQTRWTSSTASGALILTVTQ